MIRGHYVVKGIKNIWWSLSETWELIEVDQERKENGVSMVTTKP
jgi:hypothetical protein